MTNKVRQFADELRMWWSFDEWHSMDDGPPPCLDESHGYSDEVLVWQDFTEKGGGKGVGKSKTRYIHKDAPLIGSWEYHEDCVTHWMYLPSEPTEC